VKTSLAALRPALVVLDMQIVFVGANRPFDNPTVVTAVNEFVPHARRPGCR
jgi:hypothetical protein